MHSAPVLCLSLAAALLGADAQADPASSTVAIQTSVTLTSNTATNMDLAETRPDLSMSRLGFSFGPKSSTAAPISAKQDFAGPPQQVAYSGAALLNYLLTPPTDTPGYDNYLLMSYPGYAVSTWTDRVAGAPTTGVGSANDLWTAAVYYLWRTHPSSPPSEHPVLNLIPRFRPHRELDEHSEFLPPH